jgi:threonine synthase
MGKVVALRCIRCGRDYPPEDRFTGCEVCRAQGLAANLAPEYEPVSPAGLSREFDRAGPGLGRFAALLPVEEPVSLGEGATPLLHAPRLGARLGIDGLYLKDEGRNPTGSFKDRMAAVVVARARDRGAGTVTIASSGNGGAALAAYAARAGLRCVVFTLAGAPPAMLAQMQSYGARLVATERPADRWQLMAYAVERWGWYPASNYMSPPVGSNPYGIEGYKTIAYEIAQDLGWRAPDHVVVPTCYGDGLWGIVRGFGELVRFGLIDRMPRVHAAEVFGSLKTALDAGREEPATVPGRPTVAISIGTPVSTYQALAALRAAGGSAEAVGDDREILQAQRELAGAEGLYAEQSAAVAVAAAGRLRARGIIRPGETVVCILTATGLKQPEPLAGELGPVPVIGPDPGRLAEMFGERR